MNDDLFRAMSDIADALQEATGQIKAVLERFAKAVSGAVDDLVRQVLEIEPPELPKLKRWKPVRVLGCSPNTTTPRQRIHRIQRRG